MRRAHAFARPAAPRGPRIFRDTCAARAMFFTLVFMNSYVREEYVTNVYDIVSSEEGR